MENNSPKSLPDFQRVFPNCTCLKRLKATSLARIGQKEKTFLDNYICFHDKKFKMSITFLEPGTGHVRRGWNSYSYDIDIFH